MYGYKNRSMCGCYFYLKKLQGYVEKYKDTSGSLEDLLKSISLFSPRNMHVVRSVPLNASGFVPWCTTFVFVLE